MRTRHRYFLSIANAVYFGSIVALCMLAYWTSDVFASDDPNIPFTFDNVEVNQALIKLYEKDSSVWRKEQLYLIGMCYVHEKRLKDAQSIFKKLVETDSSAPRYLVALGNVYHMMGQVDEAESTYKQAWMAGQDVIALKQLAVLRLQQNNIAGIAELTDDLLAHQNENHEIPKLLLAYCLMVDEPSKGGPIAAAVVRSLDQDTVNQNSDIRKLLLLVTARYKAAAEAGTSPSGDGDVTPSKSGAEERRRGRQPINEIQQSFGTENPRDNGPD